MDSYRGELVQHALANPGSHGDDDGSAADLLAGDDHIGQEPPPVSVGQNERRMQVRAYNYWAGLLRDRPFPQIADLAAAERPDFANHAVLLDFSQGMADPAVTMLGEKLAQECGAHLAIGRLSDVPDGSLLSRITDRYIEILANAAPIGFEAEFVNQRGKTLLYRGILLPFSADGEHIQHIMGVINWKELADPIVTAKLQHELGIAIDPTLIPASSLRLPTWADGPVAESGEPDAALLLKCKMQDGDLAEWLTVACEAAEAASDLEERSRTALYAAIGRAWDLALAAEADPPAFRERVVAAGLIMQARAPMMPVVKLAFGAAYDKIRLAEFASALAFARRLELECGGLAGFLAGMPGGLKQVVAEERRLRRAEAVRKDLTSM